MRKMCLHIIKLYQLIAHLTKCLYWNWQSNDHFFIKLTYFKRCGDLIGIGIIYLKILLSIYSTVAQQYFLCKNLIHIIRRHNQNCSKMFNYFYFIDAGKWIQWFLCYVTFKNIGSYTHCNQSSNYFAKLVHITFVKKIVTFLCL